MLQSTQPQIAKDREKLYKLNWSISFLEIIKMVLKNKRHGGAAIQSIDRAWDQINQKASKFITKQLRFLQIRFWKQQLPLNFLAYQWYAKDNAKRKFHWKTFNGKRPSIEFLIQGHQWMFFESKFCNFSSLILSFLPLFLSQFQRIKLKLLLRSDSHK